MPKNVKTVALAGLALASGLVVAAPAAATSACTFANGVVTMNVADGQNLIIRRGAQDELLFSGTQCADATVLNTTQVDLSSTGGNQRVAFDLTGGPLSAAPDAPDVSFHLALDNGQNDYDNVTVTGTNGDDHVVAGSAGINLDADEPQSDVDVVAPGIDVIDMVGGDGADVLSSDGGASTGGAAAGQFFGFYGEGGDDDLTGSSDSQTIPINIYEPGSGDDTIHAVAGAYDLLSFNDSLSGVHVDLASGTATGSGTDWFTPEAISSVEGSPGDDTLLGDASENRLQGFGGDDVLDGRGGQDLLSGDGGNDTTYGGDDSDNIFTGAGDDVIHGGAGKDVVFFGVGQNPISGVKVDLAAGVATGDGNDSFDGVDAFVGTQMADTFHGTDARDEFYGGGGNDKLYGMGGADYLVGDTGNDTLSGGKGSPDYCNQGTGKGPMGGCEVKA